MTYSGGNRTYWFSSHLGIDYDPDEAEVREIAPRDKANLLSSLCEGETPGDPRGYHMPAIDIDHPCHLRETETPGHFHLLIDLPMPWEDFLKLLEVMAEVGIVEQGYLRACRERGSAFLARQQWKGANSG